MCERGVDFVKVNIKIPADLNDSGKSCWKEIRIDKCIAPIVRALQEGGINMRRSCCGHGHEDGYIRLQDGRELIIKQW